MKKFLLAALFLSLGSLLYAQSDNDPDLSPDELYIGLTPEAGRLIIDENGWVRRDVFATLFSEVLSVNESLTLQAPFFAAKGWDLQWVLRVSFQNPTDTDILIAVLSQHKAVRYAEGVPKQYLTYVPDDIGDSSYYAQWHLYRIQAKEAWEISKGSNQIKVAIVDDAVQVTHPDLKNNLWVNSGEVPGNFLDDDGNGYIDDINGYDVGSNDGNPTPVSNQYSHGTHTSGIAGATTDNGIGIASIGYYTSIMAVKCTYTGQPSPTEIPYGYEGITYAANAGAHIINCSWGGPYSSVTALNAIQYAQSKGCIIVAAMGNDYARKRQYPASYAGVISVIATNINDTKANYSNYFSTSTICAPGTELKSTYTGSAYQSQSGTSMASPLVAGLLGLMKGHYPDIQNQDLVGCLLSSADNINSMNPSYVGNLGAGRINAYKAMLCVDAKMKEDQIQDSIQPPGTRLFPNPAQDVIVLETDENIGEYVVYSMDGSKVSSGKVDGRRLELYLYWWAPGMYILEWQSGGEMRREKFIANP